jgi:Ser/Thr protein kinase RdoA (MazF antagonist)
VSGQAPHLVHGLGSALEQPAWPALTLDEAAAVLAHCPAAGDALAIAWHSPRPFSAAALVETTNGRVLLKRHAQALRTPTALASEHAFIAHLAANGVPVPPILPFSPSPQGRGWGGVSDAREDTRHREPGTPPPNPAGGGLTTTALALGEWTYEAHGIAKGQDLYRDRPSWTPFLNAAHAHHAGAMLAHLHTASAGFAAPPRDTSPLIASFTIVPARDPLAAAERYIAARPALAAFLAGQPWQADLAALFARHHGDLPARLADQPPLWTHNDWHPSNLTWHDDGSVATVFDFGLSTQTCALHDLATAIERSAIGWLDLADGGTDARTDPAAALALIAGYRSVRPLTLTDLDTLIALLPLVHIEFALSEADYFAGLLHDRAAARQAWQGYALDHAHWFAGAQGGALLAAIADGAGR